MVSDKGVDDKRLLIIESELGRTFKAMSRDSSTLSAVLRQAWDCSSLATLTKNSTNFATNPQISLIGHITIEELEILLTGVDTANGFGNRFLWICARSSKDLPRGGRFFDVDWRPIIARLAACLDFARGLGRMDRDPEAEEFWDTIFPNLNAGRPGLLGAMLARGPAYVMRIALIYAILDQSRTIGVDHLAAALAVWEYNEASCRFIFGDSLGDPKAEKILQALRDRPQGMTRTEIANGILGKNEKAEILTKILDKLFNIGLIHRVETKKAKGRPAELWFAGRAAR